MIYIDMNGRCGNQMFQYAFARKLSMLNGNMPITIDFFHVERWRKKTGFQDFCNQLKYFSTIPFSEIVEHGDALADYGSRRQIMLRNLYVKMRAASNKTGCVAFADFWQVLLQLNGVYRDDEYRIALRRCNSNNIFVRGYFEDPSYFSDIHDLLMKEFTPTCAPKEKNKELYNIIENQESVCVSFRVWSGVSNSVRASRDVCTIEYYERAIQKMIKLQPNAVFIVFSNDISWVRDNISFPGKVYFEDGTDEIWEKMRMMYSCKHFIMSTSTFCWWAQYLCRNPTKIVISPDHWINNENQPNKLMMEDWVKIPCSTQLS